MKKCFKCMCEKPLDAFYRHSAMGDGRLGKCKDCTKADVRANRLANIEHYRAFDKARASMPQRVAARKAYSQTDAGAAAHRRANSKYYAEGGGKAARRKYSTSEHGKRAHRSLILRNRAEHPERHAARVALGNAVRDRRVVPWPSCAVPECNCKPHAHHPDYSRPLDVVWLCPAHHRQAHALVANEPGYRREA